MASALVATPLVAKASVRSTGVARRQAVVVKAQQQESRRAVLGLVAASVLGLALVPQAEANQAAPKNGFVATAEGYVMEGTKKQGISPKRKREILDKLKAEAKK
ncbi:hypothetical protein N2152v2_008711 [Parachlorella kessleri]